MSNANNNDLGTKVRSLSVSEIMEHIKPGAALDPREAIERVLTDFELSTVRKTAISALSKGFRRRVALAGAFLPKAPLLLLDEPTDGLDPAQRDRVLDQLRKSREDRTLLVSTHSLEDVAAICDRVLILTRGTLAFEGTLEALRQSANGDLKQAFLTLADGTEEITR